MSPARRAGRRPHASGWLAAAIAAMLGPVAACWTSTAPPPVAPQLESPPVQVTRHRRPLRSPCEVTIDHLVDIERDEISKIPDFVDKIDTIREVAIASCNETQWSPELMSCFGDTVDNTALAECQSLFTSDQTSDLMRRVTEVLTGVNGPPPITP